MVDSTDRIYAIGDIHGRIDLLERLLSMVVEDAARYDDGRRMRLVFLGDYIDRGDQSREVIERLISVDEAMAGQGVFLRGNHEASLLDFLRDPDGAKGWLDWGGRQCLASYDVPLPLANADADRLREAADLLSDSLGPHLPWLQGLASSWRSGGYLFAHAGVDPQRPPDDQSRRDLLWGNDAFLAGKGLPGCRVVHGHYDAPDPVVLPHRICVDTGAYYTGRLTAVRLDGAPPRLIATGT